MYNPKEGNPYSYVLNNPLKYNDPTGLLVEGSYNKKTGDLGLTDVDTGDTVSIKAESGGKPYGLPIPNGNYEILDQAKNIDSYRLDAVDSSPRDDIHQPTGRDELRLHKPGNTIGCIAAQTCKGWNKVKSLIENTKTTKVKDNFKPWYQFWSSSKKAEIKKYGTIEVIDE